MPQKSQKVYHKTKRIIDNINSTKIVRSLAKKNEKFSEYTQANGNKRPNEAEKMIANTRNISLL